MLHPLTCHFIFALSFSIFSPPTALLLYPSSTINVSQPTALGAPDALLRCQNSMTVACWSSKMLYNLKEMQEQFNHALQQKHLENTNFV